MRPLLQLSGLHLSSRAGGGKGRRKVVGGAMGRGWNARMTSGSLLGASLWRGACFLPCCGPPARSVHFRLTSTVVTRFGRGGERSFGRYLDTSPTSPDPTTAFFFKRQMSALSWFLKQKLLSSPCNLGHCHSPPCPDVQVFDLTMCASLSA